MRGDEGSETWEREIVRRIGKWILIGFGALIVLAVVASLGSNEDETASASQGADSTVSPTPAASATAAAGTSAPEQTPDPATTEPTPSPEAEFDFEDGTHAVGDDIDPGTYRGEGGPFCYWERLSGFGGEFEDIIANGTGDYSHVVTIDDGDAGFSSEGCGGWTDELDPITGSLSGPFEDGTYIVGTDVAAGTYSAPGGQFCYWERLSGFGGEFEDIIANGTGESGQLVTIAEGDAGFETSGCGEWTAR